MLSREIHRTNLGTRVRRWRDKLVSSITRLRGCINRSRGSWIRNTKYRLPYERTGPAPNIITNPPFKLAEEFAYKAVVLASRKIALLARLGLLEGQQRRKMFLSTPLARVWVFSKRLPMMHRHDFVGEKSSSAIAFAWFVWDHAHSGSPTLGWLP